MLGRSLRSTLDAAKPASEANVTGSQERFASALAQMAEQAPVHTGPPPGTSAVPAVHINIVGAISVVPEGQNIQEGVFKNVDGHRFEDGRYKAFIDEISTFLPKERQYDDPVRTFAYGTDASFYRLNPKLVVKVHNETELKKIMPIAKKHGVPITFRAAGTSLSGQAITDSVLLKISHVGKNFRNYKVHGDGSQITLEPGLIGGEVNRILAAHAKKNKLPVQYKIGPDPSSIDSSMIGGIVANNSSGMCCGVSQNTYHTLKDMRIVLVDGTVLDTGDASSCESFLKECESDERMQRLVPDIKLCDPRAASLLVECRGQTPEALQERIDEVHRVLNRAGLPFGATAAAPQSLDFYPFHHEPKNYNAFWDVRKGLIPIVGAAREAGTSMLIEDVACPVDKLPDMMIDLIDM
eukprot:gene10103-8002_t